jgi:predicted ATP-binding protein involved in virulence
MKFYFFKKPRKDLVELVIRNKDVITFPCIVLEKDEFNDYKKFYTTFRMACFKEDTSFYYIGKVKIMKKDENNTILPDNFIQLDENYCSIGQETEYYKSLFRTLGENLAEELLKNINDINFKSNGIDDIIKTDIFTKSLIRFSEAQMLFKRGLDGILQDNNIKPDDKNYFEDRSYKLLYECKLGSAEKVHRLEMDFTPQKYLPFRLQVIIGKNGTGKTSILSNMARKVSGKSYDDKYGRFFIYDSIQQKFIESEPTFRKFICITYSPFDNYPEKDTFSFIHRTIKGNTSLSIRQNIYRVLSYEINLVKRKGREAYLIDVLKNIINFDGNDYLNEITEFISSQNQYEIMNKFSSGQIFMICTIVNIIANIEHDTLIMLDEPDLYLHPNAIIEFIKTIYSVLDYFKSYGIISTHSPFILQNIPSKYVKVFRRIKDCDPIMDLNIQTFGANISEISKEVFNIHEKGKSYLKYLNTMAQNLSIEDILELFNNDLSFNAGVYLETMIENNKKVKK